MQHIQYAAENWLCYLLPFPPIPNKTLISLSLFVTGQLNNSGRLQVRRTTKIPWKGKHIQYNPDELFPKGHIKQACPRSALCSGWDMLLRPCCCDPLTLIQITQGARSIWPRQHTTCCAVTGVEKGAEYKWQVFTLNHYRLTSKIIKQWQAAWLKPWEHFFGGKPVALHSEGNILKCCSTVCNATGSRDWCHSSLGNLDEDNHFNLSTVWHR